MKPLKTINIIYTEVIQVDEDAIIQPPLLSIRTPAEGEKKF